MQTRKPLIFFDGICHLCNSFVDLLLRKDKNARFQLASLQGETARKLLRPEELTHLGSVILLENGQRYERSEAILRILTGLGGIYKLALVGYLVPRPFRNRIYSWVAKNRYRWFGQRETCRLPTPAEKERLLP